MGDFYRRSRKGTEKAKSVKYLLHKHKGLTLDALYLSVAGVCLQSSHQGFPAIPAPGRAKIGGSLGPNDQPVKPINELQVQ